MNRATLSWALTATIPHVDPKGTVGIAGQYVYATDKYTTGMARTDNDSPISCWLPAGEAKDLARFVRTTRKAQEVEDVQLLISGDELHVGIADDSAVFDCEHEGLSVSILFDLLQKMYDQLNVDTRETMFQPSLLARFAKAGREGDDVLRMYPRLSRTPTERGVWIVTVGQDFLGAIAGLSYDLPSAHPSAVESFIGARLAGVA